MRRKNVQKPDKPWPDYPLFAHRSGQWAKRVSGKIRYYGVWADPNAALAEYRKAKDYHHAGLEAPTERATVADLLDAFLGTKDRAHKLGEISQVAYNEYEATCDVIADHLGRIRPLRGLTPNDLGGLRTALGVGKTKQFGPVTLKRRLTIARMVMKYAKKLGETIDYADELQAPPAKLLRKIRKANGQKLYTAAELRKLVEAAGPHLEAMILLGINAGFGPQDCCTLPMSALDLKGGWQNYARPKTEIDRRCPLWPETVDALLAVMDDSKLVFNGRNWNRHVVSREFETLCDNCKVTNHGFYSLRRTFETIATTADVSQAVIDSIMGHSRQDMASVYRQKLFDTQLRKCTEHVRQWYLGAITLE